MPRLSDTLPRAQRTRDDAIHADHRSFDVSPLGSVTTSDTTARLEIDVANLCSASNNTVMLIEMRELQMRFEGFSVRGRKHVEQMVFIGVRS